MQRFSFACVLCVCIISVFAAFSFCMFFSLLHVFCVFASFLCLQHLVVACVFGVFGSASFMYMQRLAVAARDPVYITLYELYQVMLI